MCRPGAFACPCAPTRPGAPTDRGEDRRPWSETRSVTNAGAPSRARPWPRVSPGSSVGRRRPAQKQKTCKLVVYRFPASSRPCLGGEYEILSCVSHFFCSLNISILYLYFCPDCAIFVPNLSREIILIFRYYLKKSGKIYYPTSAHPAGPTSWTMPFFSSKRSMVRCCSAIVSCCEQTVSINIDILSNTSLGKLMFSGFCSPSIFIPSLMSISCKVFASKTGRFSHCPIV